MKPHTPQRQKLLSTLLKVFIAALLLLILYIAYQTWLNHNYAQEVERPIGKALLEKGATLVCAYGYSGKGGVAKAPWYVAYYEVPKNQDATKLMLANASKIEGYNLVQATPDKRGPVSVNDEFLHLWMYDASKSHSFNGLEHGKIVFEVSIQDKTLFLSEFYCGKGASIRTNESTTGVAIHVGLPRLK